MRLGHNTVADARAVFFKSAHPVLVESRAPDSCFVISLSSKSTLLNKEKKEKRKRPDKQLYVPRALRGEQGKSLSPQNKFETESEKNYFVENDKETGGKAKRFFPIKHAVSETKNDGESSCNMVKWSHNKLKATNTIKKNKIVSKSVSYPLPDKLIQCFDGSLVSSSPEKQHINLQCDQNKQLSTVTKITYNIQDPGIEVLPKQVTEYKQLPSLTGVRTQELQEPETKIFSKHPDISSVTENTMYNLQDIVEAEAFSPKVTEDKQLLSVTGIATQNLQDPEKNEIFPKDTAENKDISSVPKNTMYNLQDIEAEAFSQKVTEDKQLSFLTDITAQNPKIKIFPKDITENKNISSLTENMTYNLQNIGNDAFRQKVTEDKQISSVTGITIQNLQDPEMEIFPKVNRENRDISVTKSMMHNQDIGTEAFLLKVTEVKDLSYVMDSKTHCPQDPGTELTDKPTSSEDSFSISEECSLRHIDTAVHSSEIHAIDISSENSFDETDDSWETKFNDDGECLDPYFVKDLHNVTGRIKVLAAKKNYSEYQPLSENTAEGYDNIVELFDFPLEFNTQDLVSAFSLFQSSSYTIKWIDDCHALAIFTSPMIANQALQLNHPFVKVRPISEGIKESQSKARWFARHSEPIKPRPTTSAVLARRLVSGALGLRVSTTKEQREIERNMLKEAKEKRRLIAKQKQDIWDGLVQ